MIYSGKKEKYKLINLFRGGLLMAPGNRTPLPNFLKDWHCLLINAISKSGHTVVMKKLLGILVLGLLWCSNANAAKSVR